ncbi:ABC transporter permease, partial [Candidatus Bipolaricaulota bacterium]|nr:ABC transporter permease [Candidatus Bipolaricaulota bacterium]
MSFSAFLVRRLFYSIIILIGLSMLIFTISRIMPGDPARLALGARAPQEVVQRWREWMHLDEPIHIQYYYWVKDALQGKLGQSLWTRRDVSIDVASFLPATMELVLFSGIIMTIFGILLGAISARYKNTWIDNLVRVGTYFGVATPAFIIAILLLLLFGYVMRILPTMGRLDYSFAAPPLRTGMITIDALLTGNFTVFWDAIKHLIMPSIALAMGGMAQEARLTRSSMADNLMKDYIAVARSNRIPPRVITLKYLLKPSLIPTVSILGLDFAALLSNA